MKKKLYQLYLITMLLIVWGMFAYLYITPKYKEFPHVLLFFTPILALSTGGFGTALLISILKKESKE